MHTSLTLLQLVEALINTESWMDIYIYLFFFTVLDCQKKEVVIHTHTHPYIQCKFCISAHVLPLVTCLDLEWHPSNFFHGHVARNRQVESKLRAEKDAEITSQFKVFYSFSITVQWNMPVFENGITSE